MTSPTASSSLHSTTSLEDGDLPADTRIVGFARRDKSDEEFRTELEAANREHSRQGHDDALWENFASTITYHRSEFQDLEGYRALADRLDQLERESGSKGNRLFYLASAPEFFDDILLHLKEAGLNEPKPGCWSRVVVEKPFGTDLPTAEHLNEVVNETFEEKDTYRIDHYLGKETAQNIMVLRFANAIFEPLWNSNHVDHVQITCAEHLGMEGGRGGYYDKAGALRDMVQNHLLQLLSLIAMEPPTDLSADGVRDEKVKVVRSLPRVTHQNSHRQRRARPVHRGLHQRQETSRATARRIASTRGLDDRGLRRSALHHRHLALGRRPILHPHGKTAAQEGNGDLNPLQESARSPLQQRVYSEPGRHSDVNILAIRIQPDEGISLRMHSKIPGTALQHGTRENGLPLQHLASAKVSPEAYERLLLDAIAGDATLFARRDEVEHAWRFVDAHRGCLAPIRKPSTDRRVPGRFVGTEGSRRPARQGRSPVEEALVMSASLGSDIPIGNIDAELRKLWLADEANTRASLTNFAIYSERDNSLEENTRLIEEITADQACRAIVIHADPGLLRFGGEGVDHRPLPD